MSEQRSCIIVDQHPVVRLGLRRALPDGWECEEAADVEAAAEMIHSYGSYDVALIALWRRTDVGASGTDAIRKLRAIAPGLGIIAIGRRPDRHTIDAATRAGALGFVSALASTETIRAAVTAGADGTAFIEAARAGTPRMLTRRQIEVLQHLADGHSTEQTAKRLGLSEQTIKTHAKGILSRLDANGRAHAVALAIRAGLID